MRNLILSTLDNQLFGWSPFGPAAPLFISQAARAATEIRKGIENDEVDEEDGPYGSSGYGMLSFAAPAMAAPKVVEGGPSIVDPPVKDPNPLCNVTPFGCGNTPTRCRSW
jgi:hypothetical protein